MAYGGQILRSDGTYWLTPDQTPLNLVKREHIGYGYSTAVQYYDTGVSTSRPCAVFQRITNGDVQGRCFGGYLIQRNGTWQVQLNGTPGPFDLMWYVFSNYVVAPTAYDIAYYNASGQSVWNGSSRPLQLHRAAVSKQTSVAGGTVVIDAGQTVAVMPSFSGSAVESVIGSETFVASYCYKAVGNQIKIDLADLSSSAGYVEYYIGVCFYIRTQLYDY